ncbi:hypothetical protein BDW22DRAFT_4770 [Trametopsis cervina]|nr:hypothetical protein BDW22DRAFT_4770 [Trametopsis cervina]
MRKAGRYPGVLLFCRCQAKVCLEVDRCRGAQRCYGTPGLLPIVLQPLRARGFGGNRLVKAPLHLLSRWSRQSAPRILFRHLPIRQLLSSEESVHGSNAATRRPSRIFHLSERSQRCMISRGQILLYNLEHGSIAE